MDGNCPQLWQNASTLLRKCWHDFSREWSKHLSLMTFYRAGWLQKVAKLCRLFLWCVEQGFYYFFCAPFGCGGICSYVRWRRTMETKLWLVFKESHHLLILETLEKVNWAKFMGNWGWDFSKCGKYLILLSRVLYIVSHEPRASRFKSCPFLQKSRWFFTFELGTLQDIAIHIIIFMKCELIFDG